MSTPTTSDTITTSSNLTPAGDRYEGGCHCGRIRFAVWMTSYEITDCNCSMCTKKGILHYIVEPSQFQALHKPDDLQTYTFNTHAAKHHFCATCGIHPYYRPRSHPGAYDVNVRCLDDYDTLKSRFTFQAFNGREWEKNVNKINPEYTNHPHTNQDTHNTTNTTTSTTTSTFTS